ncbi:RNA polymerase II-associated protein 3-like [Megalops cyprinoides]|uniref:RNA polymerase II-associated protein 3-like n=1 Tax=Megalops cyprinoides TaxID=118141 RepID=UPI001863CC2D|nr:RNA polymerase II-associated protein 3-like [Megalops cyprinoides]
MSKGTDWESVMQRFREDSQFMQFHEAMVDLISGRAAGYNSLDPFNQGILVPGFLNIATVYDEEDEYSDDDSDYEDHKHKKEYCGFSKNFLDPAPTRSRSPHPTQQPYKSQITEFMCKEAEKNAKELVEEEERRKEKAEKKRLKKMENAVKNKDGLDNTESEKSVKSQSSSSEGENIRSGKEGADRPPDTGPGEAREKSPDALLPVESAVNSNEEDSEEESAASEPEELDMNSCFVSKAAMIAKRKLEVKVKAEKKEEEKKRGFRKQQQEDGQERQEDQQNADVPRVEDVVMRSMELAVIGNQLAATGRYEMAVKYFTDAIKYNPKEFRLFGNRSFCYERMQQYEKSLIDADITLTMRPGWIKGLYRRGRALAGLKRYCEAALAFKEVLKLDSSCTDAAQELMRVQIMQLMEMGFSREQSSNALIIHGTVEKALEAFSNFQDGQFGTSTLPAARAVQPAEEEWSVAGQKAHSTVSAAPQPKPKPRPAPLAKPNPAKPQRQLELFPIWVGNLIPSISDKMIHELFSTAGEIHSVKVLRNKRCAFINYINKEDCEKAILKTNGKVIQGTTLLVRYPDKIHADLGVSKSAKQDPPAKALKKTVAPTTKKSSDECFFWRTTGCTKKESCTYQHIPKNKGIDRGQDKSAS